MHGENRQLLPQCFRAASAQLPRTLGAMTDDDDDDDDVIDKLITVINCITNPIFM